MKVLVTGSSGLIGSEAVRHYDSLGHSVIGVDNNMRREFFGPKGDTTWNLERLRRETSRFTHLGIDIRNRTETGNLRRYCTCAGISMPKVAAMPSLPSRS